MCRITSSAVAYLFICQILDHFRYQPGLRFSSADHAGQLCMTHQNQLLHARLLNNCANMAVAEMHMRKKSDEGGGLTFALQALLARHESYIAESEAERKHMANSIASLENDKRELQTANEKIISENRELLDKLEDMNNTVANSDLIVKNLEATLASAQVEVRRLTSLAAGTEDLERQLMEMEVGRAKIAEELDTSQEEKSSALSRWREAEMKVRDIEEDLSRIEAEAQRETERHNDLVRRMERQKIVEKELESAAGRLKGSAAANALHEGNGKKSVVSSFVRDILQDNANLQAGIMELRELLHASNEDVESMREQVLQHQPILADGANVAGSLDDQLQWSTLKQVSQEVHVHHHYHAKFSTPKSKATVVRRNSRKRPQTPLLGSTPESTTPLTPQGQPRHYISSPVVPAMSLYQPVAQKGRWSVQTGATGFSSYSSVPSSPQSYLQQRDTSIFDRLEHSTQSSRPTSPESAGRNSPGPELQHKRGRPSDFSLTSFDEMQEDDEVLGVVDMDKTPQPSQQQGSDTSPHIRTKHDLMEDTIVLRPPNAHTTITSPFLGQSPQPILTEADAPQCTDPHSDSTAQSALHRISSRDSLLSISGMDIHIAKSKPSQVSVLPRGTSSTCFISPSPAKPVSTAQPLASVAEVTASSSRRAISSSTASSSSVAMLSGLAGAPTTAHQARGLGRLVGGWVRGTWGVAPMKSTSDLRSSAQTQATTQSQSQLHGSPARPMGINQKGAIPGLRLPLRTPTEVHAKAIDTGLLSESLRE